MIQFDGTNIENATYMPSDAMHESTASNDFNMYEISDKDGYRLLKVQGKEKTITIKGKLIGTSKSDLETKIDSFNELMSRVEKNLDFDWGGSVRRYVATAKQPIKYARRGYNLTWTPYQVDFVVPLGYGEAVSSTNFSSNAITNLVETDTITTIGSKAPLPIITLTINAENGLTTIVFKNNETGDQISIAPAGAYTAGDVVIINTDTSTVFVNGTEQDFTGIFPEFVIGSNSFTITCTATSVNYDLDIDYTSLYL